LRARKSQAWKILAFAINE